MVLLLAGCTTPEYTVERKDSFTIVCLISQCEVEVASGSNSGQSEGGESVDVTPL
jgi:hypothetical protein